jgi:myosin light chain 6
MVDAEAAKKVMSVYDWDAKGVLDMYYFMDIVYALGHNITKKACVKFGQQEYEEKKYIKFDEVIPLLNNALKEPDNKGDYHDYIELCKLYDKNENGTMMLAELMTILNLLGDEIPKEDCETLLTELGDKEDEDGFFPYTPFLDRLCGKA